MTALAQLALMAGGAGAVALALGPVFGRLGLSAMPAGRREGPPQSEDLGDAGLPAIVTDHAGVVLGRSRSATGDRREATTLAAFCRSAAGPVDEAALFRLAREALDAGLAVAPIPGRHAVPGAHLAVRRLDGARLAWTILPPNRVPSVIATGRRSVYETAPFAHLRIAADGGTRANSRFNAVFGEASEAVIARLAAGADAPDARIALPMPEGAPEAHAIFRHFATLDPATGARDVYLFPIDGPGEADPEAARLDAIPAAVVELDVTGRILRANAAAKATLGPAAAQGAELGRLVVPTGRPLAALVQAAAASPGGRVCETAQLADGEGYLKITLGRSAAGQGAPRLVAVLTDASDMRRLEDQFTHSQKMEAVGKLAGGVAHDFNNVLTAIIGHCDLLMLRKEAGEPDYADLLQIVQNANRAAALVRQLLAFSRKQTLNPVTLSLRDVITDASFLLDRLVGETVRLELDLASDLWPVRADPQPLEQVLMNLVVNARDAMAGNGVVTLSARNETVAEGSAPARGGVAPGPHVVLRVRDTGPGIEPEVIDKVFDPFFTTKAKGEGTGLGLSTAYGIVRQSGGHILAGNPEGGGAEFAVYLPRTAEDGSARGPAPARPAAAGRDLTGSASVMLVEDEDPVRAFAARALRLRGYRVTEAETAEDAMDLLADPGIEVDLLVSDVVMPGMSGPAFAQEARKLRPGLRLVLVSGYAEESFRDNLDERDFLFLPKPFTLDDLTAKVKEALEG